MVPSDPCRNGFAACALVALCTLSASAHGQEASPRGRLVVEGDCPGPEQMRRALSPYVQLSEEDEGWLFAIRPDDGVASLEIFDPQGAASLRREVESTDCSALADAFAVIVHAHFRQLHTLNRQPPPAPPAVTVATGRVPAVETSPSALGDPAHLRIGIVVGTRAADAGFGAVGFAQVETAWSLRPMGLFVRGLFAVDTPGQSDATDPVSRFQVGLGADAGYRVAVGQLWVQPSFGMTAIVSRVGAADVPTRSRIHPAFAGALALGTGLGGRWSARVELGASLFLVADRYVVEPVGEVGRSPRGSISLGLALEWHTGS